MFGGTLSLTSGNIMQIGGHFVWLKDNIKYRLVDLIFIIHMIIISVGVH